MDTGGAPSDDGRPSQGGRAISTGDTVTALRRDGEEITDHDLVARVRAGDDRAFERLYTRYHRRIASYIQGMVNDHARAEDIAQDVFMSALRRMRETDRAIAFKPWVYEIAKNACIDQFRRARRAEEVSMDADEGLGSADYGRLVSSTPTPDVAHDHKQQIDHLRGAFGGLSETHHEILVMRELEGLSYREIGDKLGMTRPAVESTLFRARRRLTEEYDQLVTGERCVRVQQIIATAGGSALGARDRRRVARHVSYCQPCLRHARLSGMDARDLVHKPVRQKIAALLPLPAFLKERWGASPDVNASLAHWSANASLVDPGMVSAWGKAAATAATIALAGVSAGVATNRSDDVRGALGGVTLDAITGKKNPGGSGGDERLASRSGGGSAGTSSTRAATRSDGSAASGGSGARATSQRGSSSAGGGFGGAQGDGGSGGGGGSETTSGGGESAGGAAGGGTGAAAPGGTDAGRLLEGLGGASSGGSGSGSGGGGGGSDKPKGDGDSGGTVQAPVVSQLPTIGGGQTSDSGGKPGSGGSNGDGGGAGNTADQPDNPVTGIGEKSVEVVGGLTGG